MGYWISKLESLPNIFDWYFFLVGDYRNHGLINDVFKNDFSIIAERLGRNAAIISENHLLEQDLQDSLKDFERGKLGAFLSDLEKGNPGLLILNKHPNDLSHFNMSKSETEEDVPVIIYIPFEILEMAYASGNVLISDIVAFSKNQDDNLIKKTTKFGCIKDNISRAELKKKQTRIVTINYTKNKKSEKVARCIKCERIIYLNEYEKKERCIYCGYLNPVQKAINNRFSVSSANQDIECMCGYTIKNAGIYGRYGHRVVCPYCGVELHVKGMPIKVQGRNHREVLEVANELLNKSFTLLNKERKKDMEKILICGRHFLLQGRGSRSDIIIIRRTNMKKTKLLTWILTVALIVAVGASLVACVDKPGPTQPQELKIPSLAADQMAVIIKNGEGDYTYYTVTLTDEMHTGEDVVNYLVAEQQLTVKWNDSDYGKYITEIGSLKPDEAKGEFVSILTSVADEQGTWAGTTTYEADGVTLASAAVGISEMSVMAGAVIYFEVDTY